MTYAVLRWLILVVALIPFGYYLLAIYSARRFFLQARKGARPPDRFAPPASILKPVRGLDRGAHENFASFCRVHYPEYEILFAVSDADDPAIPVIQKLMRDFPERSIRLLVGVENLGSSGKVCKLCRLVREARYDLLVISDSDVRVEPGYLRSIATLFRDTRVGAATTLFRGMETRGLIAELDCVGSSAEFCAGAIVARQLEGVKFTLGATMATTRERLAEIGGFEALVDHHSDDYELGKRIAARGYRVELVSEPVWMGFPPQAFREYVQHQLRWAIGLRHVRPKGHLGLLFAQGLPWSIAASAVAPSTAIAAAYLGGYVVLRFLMAWMVGVWGLQDPVLRRRLWLLPLRDALAFPIWLASFAFNRIRWRGLEFTVEKGRLVPVAQRSGRS
ncbi:MAG TPA: bacteriohopanetetrol glucosamine biosynthesis glycosyltransferase HpnI [Candidatus Acidoferrales bacterium]|nr:bacteriohopanetetrol glucosamine biosynthesis glycosyltransferase HpnI [Candidatus Acidoferrales bacterium]